MIKKIMIIGSSGMLGSALIKYFKQKKYKLISIAKNNGEYKIDCSNFNNCKKIIKKFRPNIIINCAGLVSISKCEKNFFKAYNLNSKIVLNFTEILKKNHTKIKFIQISTDHFYFFNKKRSKKETEALSFGNNYAISKFIGESYALSYYNSLIIRTNIIDFSKKSFCYVLIKQLLKNKKIYLLNDYICSTIHVNFVGEYILKLIKVNAKGIYNLSSRNFLSKKDFFIKLIDNTIINYNNHLIKISSAKNLNVPRPLFSALNNSKIEKKLGLKMPTINKTIKKLADQTNTYYS